MPSIPDEVIESSLPQEVAVDVPTGLDRAADAALGPSLVERAGAPIREAVAQGALAGAAFGVALPDGTTQFDASGYADLGANREVATDSIFWIASLTKSMTSTLVMMLVDDGKIALDAPVERYLPEFRRQTVDGRLGLSARPRRPATVADLMRHVSGLPALAPRRISDLDRMTLAEKAKICGALRLASQPGEKFLYSNLNYEVLGRLIEVVAGCSYESFLQERLLDPLDMRETTFRPTATQLSRLVAPYAVGKEGALERRPFGLVSEPFDDPARQATPSFGLFSTASDCLRFCRLHLQGGEWQGRPLFSPASAAQMLRRFDDPPGAEFQGLAWSVAPGSACISGTLGTWMTLHLRLGVASVFLSATGDFAEGAPRAACLDFIKRVGGEVRADRAAERRRVATERRLALAEARRAERQRRRNSIQSEGKTAASSE